MNKKILILFIAASYISFVNITLSQLEPYHVNLNTEMRLPEVFPLAENHFHFEYKSSIEEIRVISDSVLWKIKSGQNGTIILYSHANSRSNTQELDSVVQIRFKMGDGETVLVVAPITPMADVKIESFSFDKSNRNEKELNCEDTVAFRAYWDYPSYVKKIQRVYVVLDMVILANNERIHGFTGWYDSGDMTKPQDLSRYKGLKNIEIKVSRLNTLHRFIQNGKPVKIKLSENYPHEWKVECFEDQ